MYYDVIIAGFGGQGVLLLGSLLAQTGMEEGHNVTFIPVYGAEMRGGTANCTVVISDSHIGAPIVARPHGLIAMNTPSLDKFQPMLKTGGLQVINSSLIDENLVDKSKNSVLIPMNDIANTDIGNAKLVNMIALGAFIQASKCLEIEAVIKSLSTVISKRYHHLLELNEKAIRAGYNFK